MYSPKFFLINYLFCVMNNYYNKNNIIYTPETICNNFNNILNKECISYFNTDGNKPMTDITECNVYIHENENVNIIQEKLNIFIDVV